MPLKTNMQSLKPRRQAFSREIILLSRGYTNPTAWPEGRITVYPWDSSIDEFMLEQVRRSKRTEVVFSLVERLCNLNGGKIDDLLTSELMTILLTARAMAAGEGRVVYNAECPSCHHANQEAIVVPDELEKIGEKAADYPGWDDILLADAKDTVRIRPLTVRDEKIVTERSSQDRQVVSDRLMRTLLGIVSINGSTADTLDEMLRWYNALTPADLKFLETEQDRLSPHLNTDIQHICDECGTRFTYRLGFETEFFRGGSAPAPGGTLETPVQPGVGR
jgi:hypothetical protein